MRRSQPRTVTVGNMIPVQPHPHFEKAKANAALRPHTTRGLEVGHRCPWPLGIGVLVGHREIHRPHWVPGHAIAPVRQQAAPRPPPHRSSPPALGVQRRGGLASRYIFCTAECVRASYMHTARSRMQHSTRCGSVRLYEQTLMVSSPQLKVWIGRVRLRSQNSRSCPAVTNWGLCSL